MNHLARATFLFCASLYSLFSGDASASCLLIAKTSVIDLAMGTVTVPRSAAIGQVIASRGVALTGVSTQPIANCTESGALLLTPSMGTPLDANSDAGVYSTNVEGIGIRFWLDKPGSLRAKSVAVPCSGNCSPPPMLSLIVELVKTASRVGSGPLLPGAYVNLQTDGDRKSWIAGRISGGSTVIHAPACEVDVGSNNIAVVLPPMKTTSFRGIQSTAGDTGFAITLNCSESVTESGNIARVTVRLDGPRDPAGSEGTLSTASANNCDCATGVGVEITDETGTAITLGKARSIGKTSNGIIQANYRARYRQTSATINAGKVRAIAEFTIAYE